MKNIFNTLLLFIFFIIPFHCISQPEIVSWMQNITNETGYNNLPSNIQSVFYTNSNIYVSCSCIPGYDIGPWAGNPNTPANQDFCFKINRFPIENTAEKTKTPLGHIGVWLNGVSIFNAEDAHSYNNLGVWYQNALFFEGNSFDECLGHPASNGEYHHHVNPTCLYDDLDDQNHSPIIGYSFDNFPIYGAYANSNTEGTGDIIRMESSYQLRTVENRTTLSDGTVLNSNDYGPDINNQFPLGAYIQDYEFIENSGDLDEFNGRFCVTPEYPNGTYAYFVTINENHDPVYPFTIGPYYYGVAQGSGNLGPQSGHHSIPNNATQYIYGQNDLINNQIIYFETGWNMFSSYILAENMDSEAILSGILDHVIILKDVTGAALLPQFNFNGVGGFNIGEGYLIKVSQDAELVVNGLYQSPENNPIVLEQGWNIMGYLPIESKAADTVFSSIVQHVIIVKDNLGNAYLPDWDYNGIGFLEPGQGYLVKMNILQTIVQ
jgi:hypothetical protein